MKRILFCVVPEKGHLNPCIGPAQHLRRAGHEVAFYAAADIGAQLDAAGGFAFLGPRETPERHDLSRGASFAASIRDADWLRNWIRTLLIDHAPALVDAMRPVLHDWRPDVVVIDPLLYAAAIAAELEGLPWVSMSNSLNPVLPSAPEVLDSALLRTVRWLAPEREALFARYGLTARFRGCDVLSPHLTLAFTTEALVGAPPPGVELVGPAMPVGARGDEAEFPWERLDAGRPLVYMSLGSQLYYHPELFLKVIEATRESGAQLVLSVGELVDAGLLPTDDPRVVIVRYAPQLALLERTQAFISHGGANSVMEALASGVPMLLSPFCNDQFHSAHFVVRAGAGLQLDLEAAGVVQLGDAIVRLLRPGPLREGAARIRESYARDGSAEAAQRISALAAGSRRATAS
ncbi:glycosyltransferase [Burkholderia plantarii]|uniref:glycosyltransferase n=1 Tax=Burkholderia plantarii TaxID=41899 RepID=UPI0018DC4EFF|nr:glycosyltransferase [Burkholderia plantarii]MBI0329274.1 glycosyltransferase family 1 protein [Burkholderia plantarii]